MYIRFDKEMLNENNNIQEYIKHIVLKQAQMPNSGTSNTPNPSSNQIPGKPTDEEVLEATKLMCATIVKAVVGYFITIFVDTKLSGFAVNTIKKNQENKPLFDFINKEVEKVYKQHKDYRPCSARQFRNTTIYNYMLAEWRDKSAKDKAKLAAYKTLDGVILASFNAIPVPGAVVLSVPFKMMLTYVGCDIGMGSVYTIAAEVDGNTLSFGINFRPVGFTLSNIALYTFNKEHKLIATPIKNPPEKLYKITQSDIDKILDKFGKDSGLDTLKEWVKQINENQ